MDYSQFIEQRHKRLAKDPRSAEAIEAKQLEDEFIRQETLKNQCPICKSGLAHMDSKLRIKHIKQCKKQVTVKESNATQN